MFLSAVLEVCLSEANVPNKIFSGEKRNIFLECIISFVYGFASMSGALNSTVRAALTLDAMSIFYVKTNWGNTTFTPPNVQCLLKSPTKIASAS